MGENGPMRRSLLVVAGGAAGATVRWAVDRAIDVDAAGFPWATLLVNLVGCVAIGLAARRWNRDSDVWHGVVVGVLGGLTTFSAFAVETEVLLRADRFATATAYVAASMAGGVLATELALRTGGER